jgi:chromosomal replication initiator protein
MQTFASWIVLPENQAAQLAVEQAACRTPGHNPLFLHGPAGVGKSHLVAALVARVSQQAPDTVVSLLSAGDFQQLLRQEDGADLRAARQADLLVVEDLQHLSFRHADALASLMDHGQARKQQQVFTALAGPAQLTHLPGRLTSRLASGLVTGLLPLSPASRLAFLRERVRRQELGVDESVLAWLAEHMSGSVRQLEGAVARLAALVSLHGAGLDVATVADVFGVEAEAGRPTVERIAQRVGRYFQVEPRQMQSRRRTRAAMLPRQVGMYLARRLTGLSLEQIGAYFGGRDHSTVLHACRKVEQALAHDVALSGAVRQLHADLT